MATVKEKESQELTGVAERAVEFAQSAGANASDVLVEEGTEFRGDVLDGKAENIKQARTRGLGIRVFVDNRVAVVYTSDLRDDSLKDLAARAVNLARQSSADEFAGLPDGSLEAKTTGEKLKLYDDEVVALTPDQKIAMAIEMEKTALAYDSRIKRLDGCSVVSQDGNTALASSNGGAVTYTGTGISLFCNPLADEGDGKQQSGWYGATARALADCETPEEVATEGARRAVERIGARSVETQKVPVIMHPDIAASWISNLFGAFSGDDIFKKTSYLTEMLGKTIASDLVTVIDDGTMVGGISTSPFDGEGQPTQRNVLIDKGGCKMFVYDTYWARKAGTQTTGNATRGYTGVPGIGHRNLYLEKGKSTPEEIMKSVDKGFYMVDQGAFGYNPTTGNYSYQAAGFWIEKGAIAFPVQEVTAASNTLEMLKSITMVGNDLRFNGSVNAPTILIAEMTISGSGEGASS
jgi:PmbA protein